LDELMSADGNPLSIPDATPVELVDNDPLEQPVDSQFRTGTMSLGWDPSTMQVVIEAFPVVEGDDEDSLGLGEATEAGVFEPEEMMVVRIPVGTARAFAKRTLEIVGAGRPLCELCGTPIDPEGHTHVLPGGA
ncbi:MAG: hypothetical protein JWR01_1243, partial [Subtercola sp.]|nr:hypothetical protein [Subtercola sp.]